MKTYERHEFTKEMLAPTPDVPDQMAIYREALETTPDVPDGFSALKIAEVERLERIREREEARPVEPEPIPEFEVTERKLHDIKVWCDAYPLDVFPEPDLKKARQLLEAGGMTLDAVSASSMRHVLNGVRRIIET